MSRQARERRRKRERLAVLLAAVYAARYLVKEPCRESALTGAAYVNELLSESTNKTRSLEQLRMDRDVFKRLKQFPSGGALLQDSANVSVNEQLCIFLYVVGLSASNRSAQDRFQHSGETISKHFSAVLKALVVCAPHFIRLPSAVCPPEIADNPKFYPYFKNCIGAFDGTLIPASVPVDDQKSFRNRKGTVSQNVLAACSFNMRFLYVLSGWEGSAADATVLDDARNKDFKTPHGKYYLGDAGYGLSGSCLTPFRGVRYHLREWAQRILRPQNAEELFNLRHAQLRNVIERVFGVMKKRFPILKDMPAFPVTTQAAIILALCVLHNFIRSQTMGQDYYEQLYRNQEEEECCNTEDATQLPESSRAGSEEKEARRRIAQAMWEDYCTLIGQ